MVDAPSIGSEIEDAERLSPTAKRAVRGACLGFTVDYFDIYLATVALTPAIGYFQAPDSSPTTLATLSYIALAVTLIGRPVGALIFGWVADLVGRKPATMVAVGGAGTCTLLIALLPGHASIGWASMVLLLVLRFVGGVFMGGEYSSANPLALEASPRRLRGLVGGLIAASYPVGYIAISVVVAIVLLFAPAGDLDSAYVQWGWRIPFFVGAALTAAFLLYFRRVEESPLFEQARRQKRGRGRSPLAELFAPGNRGKLGQIFVLMTGLWFTVQATLSAIPALLSKSIGLPSATVNDGLLIANVFVAIGYVSMALLGQRFGRKKMLVMAGVWVAVLAPFVFAAMVSTGRSAAAGHGSVVVTIVLAGVALVLTLAHWGIISTYIIERFSTGVRSSGYGIGYSAAVIVPGFYAFYMLGLSNFMPYELTPVVLLVIGGIFTVVGALLGPETRNATLSEQSATRSEQSA